MSAEQNLSVSADTLSELLSFMSYDGKVSPRRLLHSLKQDFNAAKTAFRSLCRKSKTDDELSESLLWLCDHYEDMEESFRFLKRSLRAASPLSACGALPYCFVAAVALFEKFPDVSSDSLPDMLLIYCDEHVPAGLSFEEISLYPQLLDAAVLSLIGKTFREECDKNVQNENAAARYIRLFCALQRYNSSDAAEKCRAEMLLKSDPSGAYPNMTEESKASLRRKIGFASRRSGLPDTATVRRMSEKAAAGKNAKERYIGRYVPEKTPPRRFYFFALCLLTFVGTLLFSVFSRPYLFFLILLPLGETAHYLTDTLFSRFYRHEDIVPELSLKEIPPDGKTLCVITALLTGEKNDASLFSRLERIYNANSGGNILFGILADLPDSRSADDARDGAILDYAQRRIDALRAKYGDVFFLFLRPRRYSKGEQAFMAHERKRGAAIELVRYIKGEKTSLEPCGENNVSRLFRTKYIITLDADTNLGLDAAKRLVGKMMHPENTPIVDKKRKIVSRGYGIMQPCMGTELSSARATPFSRLFCEGGIDLYSFASFSVYRSLFSVGNFCGKGIFDVDAFYETICRADIFPNDTILSHDILEGERLRCASLCDITLTDGFPKNELSYLKRKNRWIRGDVQNLVFLGKKVKVGEVRKEHFYSPLSKYKLLDNFRRVLVPIFSFFLLIAAFFLKDCRSFLTFCAFLPYIVPFTVDLVRVFSSFTLRCVSRKFFSSGVTVSLWQSFLRMLFCCCMSAKDAVMSLGAVLTSLYRLWFSHKKLLEWTTAACADSDIPTLSLFLTKHLLSCGIGAVFFVAVPHGLLKAAGLGFFFMPLIGYLFSRNRDQVSPLAEKDKKQLLLYARDIWKFFENSVCASENHLPPDNIRLSPYEKTAHRTSPTNIGLYLLSVLCARDLSFIDSNELYDRVRKTLDTICRLEKYRGNLYNWYDTVDCSILSPHYVSSVDSGNFVACLIALKQGLADYADEVPSLLEQISRIEHLIDETDFLPLYDQKRNLFRVGICIENESVKADENHYDFLMSESRILSYIAIARKAVPPAHWSTLSRPLVSSRGYIGLASWSGTAFEYFMPSLFMPPRKGSLQYEALAFAQRAQRERRALGAWGISESAYFAFDCDLNYQYKAFGIPCLGVKNGLENDLVLSPYSAYLALCMGTKRVLANLSALSKLGLYGKFGFYEACDFTPARTKKGYAPIKCYMAHHCGMSLAAVGNTICGSVAKRFMHDERNACAYELLEEKIPVNAVIRKRKHSFVPTVKHEKAFTDPLTEVVPSEQPSPSYAALSDGKACLLLSDSGHVCLTLGELSLFESECCVHRRPDSFYAYVPGENGTIGLTRLSANESRAVSYSFSYCESAAFYKAVENGITHTLSFTLSPSEHSMLRVRYDNNQNKPLPVCFLFYPLMISQKRYDAHQAFSGLFVEADFLPEKNILLYKRRARDEGEEETFLAVGLDDPSVRFEFETRKENLPSKIPDALFDHKGSNAVGACLSPAVLIRTEPTRHVELLTVLTHDRNEAVCAIERARDKKFFDVQNELSESASSLVLGAGISSAEKSGTVSRLLSAVSCFHAPFSAKNERDADISRSRLWKYGISGDLPLYVTDVSDCHMLAQVENLLRAFHLLNMKNVHFDLVLLYDEADRYERRLQKRLEKAMRNCGVQHYEKRKGGGIFLLEKSSAHEDLPSLYYASVHEEKPCSDVEPIRSFVSSELPHDGFRVHGGSFFDGGFYVNKEEAKAPFSHIAAGENIGTVLTQNSLGYTFCKNASEMRITPYTGNPHREEDGEMLLYEAEGKRYDLAACAQSVFFAPGKAVYSGKIRNFSYRMTVSCSVKLPRKNITVRFSGADDSSCLYFRIHPLMGRVKEPCRYERSDPFTVLFDNPLSESFGRYRGFLFCRSEVIRPKSPESLFPLCGGKIAAESGEAYFGLGAYRIGTKDTLMFFSPEKDTSERFLRSLLPQIRFIPGNTSSELLSLQKMFGTFYAYDAVFSRFLARSGYYQSGGAYGFRDQLQDAVLLFCSDKKRALAHIYRAAAHQFPEGDVLHWWHAVGNRGVRTRCSDDLLWLVYVCLEYADLFGETAFWDTPIPYLDGTPLAPEQSEVYASFDKSKLRESLYSHCVRAIRCTLSRIGRHGLCKIGSCDWCDGYSRVGRKGDGESVWVSMFTVHLLDRFVSTAKEKSDESLFVFLSESAKKLRRAIMQYGYDEDSQTFLRGYYDNGEKLGCLSDEIARIDVLPQAFASYCSVGTKEQQYRALAVSQKLLCDKTFRITKLLTPPFDSEKENPGYIGRYPPGIRENGGQYTHGALFFALGCFDCAEKFVSDNREISDFLYAVGGRILLNANPAYRVSDAVSEAVRSAYKTEPYAVAADIYSNPEHLGRGGWTHYTGAAAWLYRLTLRYIFGLRFETISVKPRLFIKPTVPSPYVELLSGSSLQVGVFGFDLTVKYIADGKKQLLVDGKPFDNPVTPSIRMIEVHY